MKRCMCKACERTFNALTGTPQTGYLPGQTVPCGTTRHAWRTAKKGLLAVASG